MAKRPYSKYKTNIIQNKSNFIDSNIFSENFVNSKEALYLVEIRRLVKETAKLGMLQLAALIESLLNLVNVVKLLCLRGVNKTKTLLIRALVEKVWQC